MSHNWNKKKIINRKAFDYGTLYGPTGGAGCPHLGVPEAARSLCMNTVLQETFADVVYGLSQPSFPADAFK